MKTNKFKAGLKAGTPQIGLWLSLASAYVADVLADIGYDWLLMDMEHAPSNLDVVRQQLQVVEGYPSTALVRPPWNDAVMVKRLLDLGAPGLVFPMVQTVDEARAAVAACRYPPKGVRGFGGMGRGNRFGRVADYLEKVEDETVVIVQVETIEAMERAEEIAAVDGVDGVFFGPADIAASMGLLGKTTDPKVWDAIFATAGRLKAHGVPCGTLVSDPDLTKQVFDRGFLFVAVGIELGLLVRGAGDLLARAKGQCS